MNTTHALYSRKYATHCLPHNKIDPVIARMFLQQSTDTLAVELRKDAYMDFTIRLNFIRSKGIAANEPTSKARFTIRCMVKYRVLVPANGYIIANFFA